MKTRVSIRLRPMRSLAFLGVASLTAMPVSVAVAGTEDPIAEAVEAEVGLASGLDNAESAKLIPPRVENKTALHAGMISQPVVQDLPPEPEVVESDVAEFLGDGEASWYGPRFAGRRTANGETFDPSEMTAAHKTLPFGSRVRVTSRRTGKSVIVRINDRGPYHGNRVIDLSEAAAKLIGIKSRGRGRVDLALLQD